MNNLVVFQQIRYSEVFGIMNPQYNEPIGPVPSVGTSLNRGSTVFCPVTNRWGCHWELWGCWTFFWCKRTDENIPYRRACWRKYSSLHYCAILSPPPFFFKLQKPFSGYHQSKLLPNLNLTAKTLVVTWKLTFPSIVRRVFQHFIWGMWCAIQNFDSVWMRERKPDLRETTGKLPPRVYLIMQTWFKCFSLSSLSGG